MPRVTRAAMRAGAVHEDADAHDDTPAPETPKGVLRDVTNHTVSTPVATAKTPNFELQVQKTPKFDPEIHARPTPARDNAGGLELAKDDSFVEHITSRTPTRPVLNLEESVEAMDALEDAIEQVSSELPVLAANAEFPLKKATPQPALETALPEKPVATPSTAPTTTSTRSEKKNTTATKTNASRPAPATKRVSPGVRPARNPTSGRPSVGQPVKKPVSPVKTTAKPATAKTPITQPIKKTLPASRSPTKPAASLSTKPVSATSRGQMSLSNSPGKPLPNTMQKRKPSGGLSTNRPAFVPTKSVKLPTTSTFVLPGEAIAAKLKAQREERQKKEEQIIAEKKTFKARPVPATKRSATLPRENKASRARLSAIIGTTAGANSTATEDKPKRTSLSIAKTRMESTRANSGVRRTTLNEPGASITKQASPRMNADELRARAKKAREEAAEKGRAASREWAEKQQKKKLASQAAAKAQPLEAETVAANA